MANKCDKNDMTGMQKLGIQSELRASSLEEKLINTFKGYKYKFLMCTVDVGTNMYYAPVTSIPDDKLRTLLGIAKDASVLTFLRDQFPFPVGEGTLVAKLYEKMGASKHEPCYLFQLTSAKTIGNIFEISLDALTEATTIFPPSIMKIRLDQKPFEAITNLSGNESNAWLLLQVRNMENTVTGRPPVDLLQLGLVLINKKTDLSADDSPKGLSEELIYALQNSYFATLTLLYDRERYFQKAVRMAIKGHIVKYGDRTDIRSQVKILQTLADDDILCVPDIVGHDQDDNNVELPFSWYKMPQFTMQQMSDLLAYSSKLQEFEVKNLAKSCFTHLQRTYWRCNAHKPEFNAVPARALVVSALALALEKADYVCKGIISRDDLITNDKPIKFKRGIDIFNKKHVEKYKDVINSMEMKGNDSTESTIADNCPYTITINWGEYTNSAKFPNPIVGLKQILDACESIDKDLMAKYHLVSAGAGRIHGDPHYANFLVDASIPEDPLIVTIDPAIVVISDQLRTLKNQSDNSIFKILRETTQSQAYHNCIDNIPKDPAYDVAKLMLSTACCYGLAYCEGFEVIPKTATEFQLKREENPRMDKPKDIGGISGAQIVRLDTPVRPESLWYLGVAAKSTIREYDNLLNNITSLPKISKFEISLYRNIAYIRLFVLTFRHALSIAEILFPANLKRSMSMYLLACFFFGSGYKKIIEILNCGIEKQDYTDELRETLQPFGGIGRMTSDSEKMVI